MKSVRPELYLLADSHGDCTLGMGFCGHMEELILLLFQHIFMFSEYTFCSKSVPIQVNILREAILASALVFSFKNNSFQKVGLFTHTR